MKKYIYLLIAAAMILALLTGCQVKPEGESVSNTTVETDESKNSTTKESDKKEIVIEHSKGTVTVPSEVDKAVVFDFGTLDTINSLGIEAELAVPVDNLPQYLKQYKNVTNAGGIKEPNLEAIFEFNPDVIFISGRQEAYYDQLSEIAPTIYVELNGESYMEDFKKNVGYVAEIFNKQDEAEIKLNEIDKQIASVKKITSKREEKALILLVNDGALSVYGLGSRFGIIHDVLGVKTADENIEVSSHGQTINYEYLSKINPDILFVIDRTIVAGGSNTSVSALDNDLLNEIKAAKNDKIISLDSDLWYLSGGGIQSVAEMISNIKETFVQ